MDLNKACLKDSFPLFSIDKIMDATADRELLSFMNAYSEYYQIKKHPPDEDKMTFTIGRAIYC